MLRIRELLNPKHTALSVAQTLVQGLEDGSIVLHNEPKAKAIETKSDQLALLRNGIKQWNEWREQNPRTKITLSGASLERKDLSGANLSGANLSGADLRRADLGRANLSGANLNGANLSNAFLSGARFSDANLSGANLSGTFLSDTDLSSAIVNEATFTSSTGLTERQRTDLKARGAIFNSPPGSTAELYRKQ